MIFNFINFYVFVLSFSLGLIYMYLNKNEKQSVFVYPTPENIDNIQYRDLVDNCFEFKSKEVLCDNNVNEIPIQY
jgi:hypothetical protein